MRSFLVGSNPDPHLSRVVYALIAEGHMDRLSKANGAANRFALSHLNRFKGMTCKTDLCAYPFCPMFHAGQDGSDGTLSLYSS